MSVSNDCFVICAVYPTISQELHEAKELISWPPDEQADDLSHDPIAAAQDDLSSAMGLARVFVVRASDDKAAADHLHAYFQQYDVLPHSLVVLDVGTEDRIDAPLDEETLDATCSYYLPMLFLMRDFTARTIESLHEFCWEVFSDGDANDVS